MKKIVALLLATMFVLSACSTTSKPSGNSSSGEKIEGVPEAITSNSGGVKIAVIRNLPSDDHTKQFLDGARSEGESFGFKVDTFIADNDDAKFQELVAQAIQKDYDGLIISHGKKDYSYDMLKPAVDKGMKVVTFDTVIEKDGNNIPDITTTFQDDFKLAELSLNEIAALSKDGNPVKVIKLWFGPGVPPLDRRESIYKKFEEENKIKTLEVIGPSNFQDVQGDIATKVSAVLAKYPAGTVDAIWGSWDEMAKGAYKAMVDNKRMDIKLISIDISNQDMNLMREQGSTWLSTAAVDPRLIGLVNMRLLAKKLAGEEVPANYDLEAKLIKQEQLKADTNMNNLKDVIDGWGKSDAFNEKWMDTLREKYGKK
ncbi:MAG: sugar ABC transporter substrate-binding protein [Bacillota bacterium]